MNWLPVFNAIFEAGSWTLARLKPEPSAYEAHCQLAERLEDELRVVLRRAFGPEVRRGAWAWNMTTLTGTKEGPEGLTVRLDRHAHARGWGAWTYLGGGAWACQTMPIFEVLDEAQSPFSLPSALTLLDSVEEWAESLEIPGLG